MFCPNCGANVPDGQPFCPNCGTRQGAAPAAPAYGASSAPAYGAPPAPAYGYTAPRAPRPVPPRRPGVALFENFNAMTMLEKLFLLLSLGLFFMTLMLSQFGIILNSTIRGIVMHYEWLLILTTLFHVAILGTLLLSFVGALKNSLFLLIPVIAGGVCLMIYVICWIANEYEQSVAGWFYFFLLMGAIATSVLYFIEEKKNGY